MSKIEHPLFGIPTRTPPGSIEAEQALLGAILATNRAMDGAGMLQPEHFLDDRHGRIFAEARKLIEGGRVADAVTLNAQFANTGTLDTIGGTGYLVSLMSAMVSPSMAADYARVIHDGWLRRQVIAIGVEAVDDAFGVETGADGQAVIASAVEQLLALGDSSTTNRPADIGSGLDDALEAASAAHRGTGPTGLKTGIAALDTLWGGLYPEALDILAARAMHGKTALGMQIIEAVAGQFQAAKTGQHVGFFSLEMSKRDLSFRMLAKETGIPSEEIREGRIAGARAEALRAAQARLRRLPILVYDAPAQTLTDIQLRARVAVRRQKVRLLVIDHLHRIKPAPSMARLSRLDQVAFITESLKDLARSLGVPILLLAQLSRDAERREDPRPTVADIKYAGEADADNIILLWRPELHMPAKPPAPAFKMTEERAAQMEAAFWSKREEVRGKAEVIGAKRRFGAVSATWLNFDGPTTSFSSPDGDDNLQEGFI